jgi:hypothetical protein
VQARQALNGAVKAQLLAADAQARQEAASRALAAAAIIGAMQPAYQQPQTIYVRPCSIYSQIYHLC